MLVHGTASALGPIVSGFLMGWFGARALPAYFAVVLLALAIYAAYRIRRVPPLPVEEYTEVAVPHVPATGAALGIVSPPVPEPGTETAAAENVSA